MTLTTGATGIENGDITLLGSPLIQKSAGATDVMLTFSAHNDIGITAAISQSGGSAVGRLNIALHADSDGNGIGNVALRTPLTTGGGTITATGQNITVLGNLTTTGTAGRDGGSISLTASPQGALNITTASVTAAGGTATSAGRSGGDIALSGGSLAARGVNADGGNAGGSNNAGGRAGTITLDSTRTTPSLTVSGNLSARGGDATGSGAGGASGAVTMNGPVTLAADVAITSRPGGGTTPGVGGAIGFGPTATIGAGNHFIYAFQPTLTVTALDASKIYGDADPANFGFTTAGLLSGDALADVFDGVFTRALGENVAAYAIDATSSPSAIGYAVVVTPAMFTIVPRPLTVRAMDASREVGSANPPFAAASPAGRYAITPAGLTSTNYRLVYVDGTLTVFDTRVLPPPPPATPPGDGSSAEAIIAARQNRPPLPTIAGLARLDIVDEGLLLPAEARTR